MTTWREAPILRASLMLHGVCGLLIVFDPGSWLSVIAIVASNQILLTGAVFFPRARLLGPNVNRLPAAASERGEVCLTFDDGPHPQLTPRVLDLLDRHGARASFFCVGEKAAAHPAIVKAIADDGHSVENHTYKHSAAFACFGLWRMGREVDRAQEVLERITGRAPAFFRAPAGFRSPLLHFVLSPRKLRYASWTRRGYDARCSESDRVLKRLTHGLEAGDILLLHDSSPLVLPVLTALLDELSRRGLRAVSLSSAF